MKIKIKQKAQDKKLYEVGDCFELFSPLQNCDVKIKIKKVNEKTEEYDLAFYRENESSAFDTTEVSFGGFDSYLKKVGATQVKEKAQDKSKSKKKSNDSEEKALDEILGIPEYELYEDEDLEGDNIYEDDIYRHDEDYDDEEEDDYWEEEQYFLVGTDPEVSNYVNATSPNFTDFINDLIYNGFKSFKLYDGVTNVGPGFLLAEVVDGEIEFIHRDEDELEHDFIERDGEDSSCKSKDSSMGGLTAVTGAKAGDVHLPKEAMIHERLGKGLYISSRDYSKLDEKTIKKKAKAGVWGEKIIHYRGDVSPEAFVKSFIDKGWDNFDMYTNQTDAFLFDDDEFGISTTAVAVVQDGNIKYISPDFPNKDRTRARDSKATDSKTVKIQIKKK